MHVICNEDAYAMRLKLLMWFWGWLQGLRLMSRI